MALLFPLLAIFLAASAQAGDAWVKYRLETGDGKREYFVYESNPKGRETAIVLHGGGGGIDRFERGAGWKVAAKKHGFLLVMPVGVKGNWNDGRPEIDNGQDDIKFLQALKLAVAEKFHRDKSRFHLVGVSNGGLMAFRFFCEAPKTFRTLTAVVANLGEKISQSCRPTSPVSFLHIVGDKDPLMPFQGGEISGPLGISRRGKALSADTTQAFLRSKMGCEAPGEPVEENHVAGDGTSVVRSQSYCAKGTVVKYLRVKGGGHTWPGPRPARFAEFGGKVSQEFSATEEAVQFFAVSPAAAIVTGAANAPSGTASPPAQTEGEDHVVPAVVRP